MGNLVLGVLLSLVLVKAANAESVRVKVQCGASTPLLDGVLSVPTERNEWSISVSAGRGVQTCTLRARDPVSLSFGNVHFASDGGAQALASYPTAPSESPATCIKLFGDPKYGLVIFTENKSLSEGAFRVERSDGYSRAFLHVGAEPDHFLPKRGYIKNTYDHNAGPEFRCDFWTEE